MYNKNDERVELIFTNNDVLLSSFSAYKILDRENPENYKLLIILYIANFILYINNYIFILLNYINCILLFVVFVIKLI